jgi:aerobic-type carbon monoxide dehydrogenase small subunit (CoxS/CutS family)
MAKRLNLKVNGEARTVQADPAVPLLSVLRDDLELTGSKYGCGEAQCGACTVLLDGRAIRSCITPVQAAEGKTIVTIEGIAQGGELHPVQQSFMDEEAMQCGYCTAGMIMSAVALLKRNPDPSEAEIASAMQGNICRCGTYPRIVRAVRKAATALKYTKGTRHV